MKPTLTVAEYHLSIYASADGSLLHTLSFVSYQPHEIGPADEQRPTTLTIAPDGGVVCLDDRPGTARVEWRQRLASPATRVFELARDSTNQRPRLVAPRPAFARSPTDIDAPSDAALVVSSGSTEYVLGQDAFPLVLSSADSETSYGSLRSRLHRVEDLGPMQAVDRLIDGVERPATIEGNTQIRGLIDGPHRAALPPASPTASLASSHDGHSVPSRAIGTLAAVLLLLWWAFRQRRGSIAARARSLTKGESIVTWSQKELPPLPKLELPENESDRGSDDELAGSTPRRPRRRKRGRKQAQRGPGDGAADGEAGSGPQTIGSLTVSESVLGAHARQKPS